MKANVFDLSGKIIKELNLPNYFEQSYRPDLIKKAVISSQSKDYQPKGNSPLSNRENTAEYIGSRKYRPVPNRNINTGKARLPRLKNRRTIMAGRVAGVSQAVGGPRAHPPKVTKILLRKINSKERTKAIISAISASANKELVENRGHKFPEEIILPIIFESNIEEINKTSEIYNILKQIGLDQDIEKAKNKKQIRAGKGKMRGRKYKKRKSILFVLNDSKNQKAFSNLEGVDVVNASNLSIKELAPGTHAGRLTVFSEAAIESLTKRFNKQNI
jgi:large subunit ribosomal protein L4e